MGLFKTVFGSWLSGRSADQDFESQVRRDGVEHASKRIAEILNEKITSYALAKQFVLEELDAARQGNDSARRFVFESGFNESEYINAMRKTRWQGEESELEHLQLFFRAYLMKISDIDLMVKLSLSVVDNMMRAWKLGKYEE